MHDATTGRPPAYPWRMPSTWWFKSYRYFMYMMRELSAVFAAIWVVLFLAKLPLLASGDTGAYLSWLGFVRSPGWVIFSLTTLVFVLYHAWTWINLMGTVMFFRFGSQRITGMKIIAPMLIVWLGATAVIGFILSAGFIGG